MCFDTRWNARKIACCHRDEGMKHTSLKQFAVKIKKIYTFGIKSLLIRCISIYGSFLLWFLLNDSQDEPFNVEFIPPLGCLTGQSRGPRASKHFSLWTKSGLSSPAVSEGAHRRNRMRCRPRLTRLISAAGSHACCSAFPRPFLAFRIPDKMKL